VAQPSPDIRQQLARLKAEFKIKAEQGERQKRAIENAERVAGQPVVLPTDKKAKGGLEESDYRSSHIAPGPNFGAPMHDVTRDMYPKDFYGPNGFRYYADFGEHHDREAYDKVRRVKDKPEETVWIHRAIPTKVYKEALKKESPLNHMIRKGDWVAISKQYAKDHGESVLLGDYKIASMRVPAKHVWTNGDSVHEWGYHPVESKAQGGSASTPSIDVMRLAIGGQGPRNWLKGSVEKVTEPLKQKLISGTDPADALKQLQDQYPAEVMQNLPANSRASVERSLHSVGRMNAMNQWIERNLGNYIRKQMGSHNDPIRKVAEEGVIHTDPENVAIIGGHNTPHEYAESRRQMLGGEQLGKGALARAWEDAVDSRFEPHSIEDIMRLPEMYHDLIEPWMHKADPKTMVYEPYAFDELGFDHIVDILKQDLAEGRIRPEQLSKVSIEQAVRRTHEFDQAQKKKMAETALKATEGMPVHKDYGNGYKWIELTKPNLKELPEGYQVKHTSHNLPYLVNPEGLNVGYFEEGAGMSGALDRLSEDKLKEALKYEGDTMGHCVGGYCPDVASGQTRIFSLRDAKNEPHVTVEVKPPKRYDEEDVIRQFPGGVTDAMKQGDVGGQKYIANKLAEMNDPNRPHAIKQIKGKGNAKPKKDYIPYVQDFVKSGNWSEVGDLKNTDLIKHEGKYLTPDEHSDYLLSQLQPQKKAQGGNVQPTQAQMRLALMKGNPMTIQSIGANEAPDMSPKTYLPPDKQTGQFVPPGGAQLPAGGVDMSQQPGQQLMPQNMAQNAPQPMQQPTGQQPQMPQGMGQSQQGSNILQMTPQGQTMAALQPQGQPPGMAKGGTPPVEQMKAELAKKKKKTAPAPKEVSNIDDEEEEEKAPAKRILVKGTGPGGVTGIVIPHHMLHGRSWISKKTGEKVVVPGLKDINKARAKVYGAENRDPLTIGQMGRIHKDTLDEHFAKPIKEQLAAEKEALARLREAKHIGHKANTLDESEKLDTVRHEYDEQGRPHVGYASKGVAGHALYISGHGKDAKYHILNTCPGQVEGCGGGTDANGVVDTSKGTCFAPGAESQYVHAAVRRASHTQAKHDPAMTRDWILAHAGSMRGAANKADKNNERLLFRPNVVDETDVSSDHLIGLLNDQRAQEEKPPIISNAYSKTNSKHDPENGIYKTHSNVGPKVKHGHEIETNIGRDAARVRETVNAADNRGDYINKNGNLTPPKGTYLVTDVKRNSPLSKQMEEHITHAKYWTTGREANELSPQEHDEGPEGHFGPSGKPTTPEKAHYGHTTVNGRRYDYQKQHVLHPRLVNVPERKKDKKTGEIKTVDHMIPTDSRFMDTNFLPKNRYKTKNGKEAGHILMTTPTESTSNLGHETSFTHNVNQQSIKHAMENNGEYEIDNPMKQEAARGKEYKAPVAPQKISIPKTWKLAVGGSVTHERHPGYEDDNFHAFPEQNVAAQRHLAMRLGDDEEMPRKTKYKQPVSFHKNIDTMRLELMRNK
jgi:hypothetical protein